MTSFLELLGEWHDAAGAELERHGFDEVYTTTTGGGRVFARKGDQHFERVADADRYEWRRLDEAPPRGHSDVPPTPPV